MAVSNTVPDRVQTNKGSDRSVVPAGIDPPSHLGSSPLSRPDPSRGKSYGSNDAFRLAHQGHRISMPPMRSRTRPVCFDCDERG